MALTDSAEEARKNFEKLQKLATSLRKDLSGLNLGDTVRDAETVKELLNGWGKEFQDSLASIDSIGASFQQTVAEISKGNVGLNQTKKSFNKLTSLASDLTDHTRGHNKLSVKQLESITSQAQQEKKRLETTLDTLKAEKASLIESRKQGNQTKESLDKIRQINSAISEAEGLIKNENTAYEDLLTNAKDLEEKQGKVNNAMGLGGTALDGMVSAMDKMGMGGLTEKLGLDEAKKKMEEMADELTNGGETAATMGQKFKIMGAGLKSMGSSLGKNLTDPAFLITQMSKALKIADDGAGDMAKKMNLTYGEALNTRRELGNMAAMSGDVALNTKNLQESYMAVGAALGTNAMLNKEDLTTMTKLVTQAGFQHSELMGVQKLSLVNGKSLKDNTKEILGGAKAYASRNKMVVNEKEVLREVNKASASLKLSLGGSASKMAEAVVQAKQFGLTLEQAEKISSSLLQFESSIESELSAELLTGKELNFEKARQLALEGKTAEAAAEVAKQVGSSKDFAKMNVIQQEALAKAAGMERDELAQSLIDKEAFAKIGVKDGEEAKKKYDTLRQTMSAEEAMKELGNETLAKQYEQQSVQEKFTQATEKLKEVFIQIAEPVLAIVSPLMNLVGSVLPLINVLLQPIVFTFQMISSAVLAISDLISNSIPGLITFGTVLAGLLITQTALAYKAKEGMLYKVAEYAIEKKNLVMQNLKIAKEFILGGIKKGNLIKTIAEAAMTAFKSVASIPIVGPLLGAAAAGAAVALGYSYLTGDDVMSPGESSNGYGKRTLFGPEGAIQLNDKDTVIAGTDLFKKGDDVMSAPKNTLKVSNQTSPPPKPPDTNTQLLDEMKKQNYLREQSNRQNKTVSTLRIQ
jgi:hypothetical protein